MIYPTILKTSTVKCTVESAKKLALTLRYLTQLRVSLPYKQRAFIISDNDVTLSARGTGLYWFSNVTLSLT